MNYAVMAAQAEKHMIFIMPSPVNVIWYVYVHIVACVHDKCVCVGGLIK